MMQHTGTLLDAYKPKAAAGDEAAARRYFAALYVVAYMKEVLKKKVRQGTAWLWLLARVVLACYWLFWGRIGAWVW